MTLSDPTFAGLTRGATLDGIDLPIYPRISVALTPLKTRVPTMDGGGVTFTPFAVLGSPDRLFQYGFTLPFSMQDGGAMSQLDDARAKGGFHTFAYWKPVTEIYTARVGLQVYVLPRYRRNAAQVFAGLIQQGVTVGTATFPFEIWINGVAQTVGYAGGPVLAAPGSGNATVAALPHTDAAFKDYVEFRLGTPIVGGETIKIRYFPVFILDMDSVQIEYPQGTEEDHTYSLMER